MDTSRRTVLATAAAAGLTAAVAGTSYASSEGGGNVRFAKPTKELFGTLADGTKVHRWSLANGGTRLKVLSYGGIVQSLELPTGTAATATSPSGTTRSRRTRRARRSSAR